MIHFKRMTDTAKCLAGYTMLYQLEQDAPFV